MSVYLNKQLFSNKFRAYRIIFCALKYMALSEIISHICFNKIIRNKRARTMHNLYNCMLHCTYLYILYKNHVQNVFLFFLCLHYFNKYTHTTHTHTQALISIVIIISICGKQNNGLPKMSLSYSPEPVKMSPYLAKGTLLV